MLKYSNGLEVPSWKVSDGTLRLLALTMMAYMPQLSGLYMIEEPENGIHPGALQDVFDSLASFYEAQVLLATHSPEFVAIADVKHLLCFGKTGEGAIDIVPGMQHPYLQDWKHETDLGTFFASGISWHDEQPARPKDLLVLDCRSEPCRAQYKPCLKERRNALGYILLRPSIFKLTDIDDLRL